MRCRLGLGGNRRQKKRWARSNGHDEQGKLPKTFLVTVPSLRYMSRMKGTGLYPLVGQILAERNWSVPDLIKQLESRGYRFDRKTVYRVKDLKPLHQINAKLVSALCEIFDLPLDQVIALQPPKLRRLDDVADKRLTELMDKNTEGELTEAEKEELEQLGSLAQALSIQNARTLVAYRKANGTVDLNQLLKQKVAVAAGRSAAARHKRLRTSKPF
jgi:hypothetical protein